MPIDTSKCQVCGEPNGCGMADTETLATSCWCKDLALGDVLREKVSLQYPEPQCLCLNCMKKIKKTV